MSWKEAWQWPGGTSPFPGDAGLGLGSEVRAAREIQVPWSQSDGWTLSPLSMCVGRGFKGILEAGEVCVIQFGIIYLFI